MLNRFASVLAVATVSLWYTDDGIVDHLCSGEFLDGKYHLIGIDFKLTISGSPEILSDRSHNVYITHHHHPLLSL